MKIILAVLSLALLAFPCFATADEGPNATVKRDGVEVYTKASANSGVIRNLDKGLKLIVESMADNPEGGWCLVRAPYETKTMGYVMCRYLAREGGVVTEESEGDVGDVKRPYSDVRVLLYMTEWCGYSKKAREFLEELGVDLIIYDVEKNPGKAREMIEKSGKKQVPFIVVGDVQFTGFYKNAIKDAVERAREKK